jgi:ketosteroid isomerase-like protein
LPGGKKLAMTGASSDVMKKQADGNWVYLVDNPYGAASLAKAAQGQALRPAPAS